MTRREPYVKFGENEWVHQASWKLNQNEWKTFWKQQYERNITTDSWRTKKYEKIYCHEKIFIFIMNRMLGLAECQGGVEQMFF